MRALIYARTATAGQDGQNLSMETQLEACRRYAREQGYEVTAEYQDAGVSGMTLDRAGLQALRETFRQGGIAAVIITGLDRLTRSAVDLLTIRKEFIEAAVTLHIAGRSRADADPYPLQLDDLDAILADFERDRLVERMAAGKRHMRESGEGANVPPFGYQYVGRGDKRRLAVDVAQAALIRQIVTWTAGSDGSGPLTFEQVMERLRQG
jgi:site-specific DNA recombinase